MVSEMEKDKLGRPPLVQSRFSCAKDVTGAKVKKK